jgi:pSer/pThr/pTyr-binding forkhead associated (FHA) protein
MIACPNCKHENPEGATNCEACYTALPATKACPSCGASIQLDATFCGQCGHNLKPAENKSPILLPPPDVSAPEAPAIGLPPTVLTNPAAELAESGNIVVAAEVELPPAVVEPILAELPIPEPVQAPPVSSESIAKGRFSTNETEVIKILSPPISAQVQTSAHQLLHLQTNAALEIPLHLQVIHLGKPNDQVPPDLDVSGFSNAEVVSRIHANIRVEGENYYIEDVGSANGTYINHNVLAKGNRHLLKIGDRIGLGKGDLVTFIFQATI